MVCDSDPELSGATRRSWGAVYQSSSAHRNGTATALNASSDRLAVPVGEVGRDDGEDMRTKVIIVEGRSTMGCERG